MDGINYNIAVAYYKQEKLSQCLEYYEKIHSHKVFEKDELYNEMKKFLDEHIKTGDIAGKIEVAEEVTDINLDRIEIEPEKAVFQEEEAVPVGEKAETPPEEEDEVEFEIELDVEEEEEEETVESSTPVEAAAEDDGDFEIDLEEPAVTVEPEPQIETEKTAQPAPDSGTLSRLEELLEENKALIEANSRKIAVLEDSDVAAPEDMHPLSEQMDEIGERLDRIEGLFDTVSRLNGKVEDLLEDMSGIKLEEIRILASELKEISQTFADADIRESLAVIGDIVKKNGADVFGSTAELAGRVEQSEQDMENEIASLRKELEDVRSEQGKSPAGRILDEITDEISGDSPEDENNEDDEKISYF